MHTQLHLVIVFARTRMCTVVLNLIDFERQFFNRWCSRQTNCADENAIVPFPRVIGRGRSDFLVNLVAI
jgi:hypothetical protein